MDAVRSVPASHHARSHHVHHVSHHRASASNHARPAGSAAGSAAALSAGRSAHGSHTSPPDAAARPPAPPAQTLPATAAPPGIVLGASAARTASHDTLMQASLFGRTPTPAARRALAAELAAAAQSESSPYSSASESDAGTPYLVRHSLLPAQPPSASSSMLSLAASDDLSRSSGISSAQASGLDGYATGHGAYNIRDSRNSSPLAHAIPISAVGAHGRTGSAENLGFAYGVSPSSLPYQLSPGSASSAAALSAASNYAANYVANMGSNTDPSYGASPHQFASNAANHLGSSFNLASMNMLGSSSQLPQILTSSSGSQYFSGRRRLAPQSRHLQQSSTAGQPLQTKSPKDILMSVQSVVKNRTGSGAPNFRMADLNVFGVAQPTLAGISTVLTLLGCHASAAPPRSALWFSAREEPMIYINRKPFVVRDATQPTKNIKTYQGINASRLEQVEDRLKEDILREESRWNGLLLVHEESVQGGVFPSWLAIENLQTPREVFENLVRDGFRVRYVRIPISPEQAPEDRYIDEYVSAIQETAIEDPVVFNCGMGVGRTTFAMVLAMLIRRSQTIAQTSVDPFQSAESVDSVSPDTLLSASLAQKQDRAILRLVYVLDQALSGTRTDRSAIEWALARGPLIEDLKNAILGNYHCIQQLMSVLVNGVAAKNALDEAINRCDVLTNLRENILTHRVKYSLTTESSSLSRAFGCLERYFFLLAFGAYVSEWQPDGLSLTFSAWFKARPEIWNMLEYMRREASSLSLFRPIEDLSVFSQDVSQPPAFLAGWGPSVERPPVTELDKHVIKSRKGTVLGPHTILKEDFWTKGVSSQSHIEGAANFRKIHGLPVYAVAQPTVQGTKNVIRSLDEPVTHVVWINLREEPLVYINGVPYVLRDQYLTLRNIKSYSGITGPRLELIEAKLKQDVCDEIVRHHGKILLHSETHSGDVVPVWEDCSVASVLTPCEAMMMLRDEELELSKSRSWSGAEPAGHHHPHPHLHQHQHHHLHHHNHQQQQQQQSGHHGRHVQHLSHHQPHAHRSPMLHGQAADSPRSQASPSTPTRAPSPLALTRPHAVQITYFRVPTTAETPPDAADIDAIVQILSRQEFLSSSIILNCQIGLGRSTTGTVIASLVLKWLRRGGARPGTPSAGSMTNMNGLGVHAAGDDGVATPSARDTVSASDASPSSASGTAATVTGTGTGTTARPLLNYSVIHSLLRVIRNGLECKRVVDDTIDACAQHINLRDSIEDCRQAAEAASDDTAATPTPAANKSPKRAFIKRGLLHLKRYYTLILFQNYLDQNEPSVLAHQLMTFTQWLAMYPEFATIREEIEPPSSASGALSIQPLIPVEQLAPGDGIALSSEVLDVMRRRNGAVLGQGSMIKYDLFPGAQKLSLPDRIEGAHNFRRIELAGVRVAVEAVHASGGGGGVPGVSWVSECGDAGSIGTVGVPATTSAMAAPSDQHGGLPPPDNAPRSPCVYGVGMPSKDGIRRLLHHVGAGPGGHRTLVWTSLREEPVIYVNGKPYVLRLLQDPLKNLEATGITRERVELMENQMKKEILEDMGRYGGRLLLHEERVEGSGFVIVPVWETVRAEDIETPGDVYASIQQEGYRVDYMRVPITDEQAPIPDVFDQLVERLLCIGVDGDALFNCQMGRGRTTTGIVTTCLMQMIVGHASLPANHAYLLADEDGDHHAGMGGDGPHVHSGRDSEADLHAQYKAGEYKIVMQLLSVLQYGKLAKALTDRAIDMADHMQNLRTAIYDNRLRVLAADVGSRKYTVLHEVVLNYLIRYVYLIVFADYLIEVWALWVPEPVPSPAPRPDQSDEMSLSSLSLDAGDRDVDTSMDSMTSTRSLQGSTSDLDAAVAVAGGGSGGSGGSGGMGMRMRPMTFSAWLGERKEILNILRRSNQSLD
ncbi:inositol hexakisphosphate-domain-containing protein [Entophlyctis helioformis]|nr:inositol hexakisphosphate-domain-containing protein [Entophlyctis helioformis]